MAARKIAFYAVLAVWAGMATVMTTAALAEPVRVQAAARGDFGRIVFSWNNPVSHTSAVKDGLLTVRF